MENPDEAGAAEQGGDHASGHVGIGEAMLSLVRNLDLAGSRLTDLAARAHITKQSMRELVDRGEALGIVERAPDDDDKRAKLVRFTPPTVLKSPAIMRLPSAKMATPSI